MAWLTLPLLALGVFLSAFFSGSETGFYRVTRMRLLLDGLGGDRVARMLLRLTNHPAFFVATTLIGNNVANYMTSLGIVLLVQYVFTHSQLAETLAPMVFSPLVFVYCELLPKQLFFHAPNRLLRWGGPLFLLFAALFSPLAAVLWLLGRLLESVLGQTPLRVRLTLARKELQQVLQEGQEAGILHPAQRNLAERLFANASQNVLQFSVPLGRVATVPLGAGKQEALRLARRQQSAIVPVSRPESRDPIGYVRVIDLQLSRSDTVESVRFLPRIAKAASHIQALIAMQSHDAEMACVEDQDGRPVGLVFADRLTDPLFRNA